MLYLGISVAIVAFALALLLIPQFEGWRTVIFNSVVTFFGAIAPMLADTFGFMQGLDWTKYVSEKAVPWVILGIGVGGIWLRYLTKGPVGKK